MQYHYENRRRVTFVLVTFDTKTSYNIYGTFDRVNIRKINVYLYEEFFFQIDVTIKVIRSFIRVVNFRLYACVCVSVYSYVGVTSGNETMTTVLIGLFPPKYYTYIYLRVIHFIKYVDTITCRNAINHINCLK